MGVLRTVIVFKYWGFLVTKKKKKPKTTVFFFLLLLIIRHLLHPPMFRLAILLKIVASAVRCV